MTSSPITFATRDNNAIAAVLKYVWKLSILEAGFCWDEAHLLKNCKRTSSAAGQTDYETLISLPWGKQKLFLKYLFYRAFALYSLKDALT